MSGDESNCRPRAQIIELFTRQEVTHYFYFAGSRILYRFLGFCSNLGNNSEDFYHPGPLITDIWRFVKARFARCSFSTYLLFKHRQLRLNLPVDSIYIYFKT